MREPANSQTRMQTHATYACAKSHTLRHVESQTGAHYPQHMKVQTHTVRHTNSQTQA